MGYDTRSAVEAVPLVKFSGSFLSRGQVMIHDCSITNRGFHHKHIRSYSSPAGIHRGLFPFVQASCFNGNIRWRAQKNKCCTGSEAWWFCLMGRRDDILKLKTDGPNRNGSRSSLSAQAAQSTTSTGLLFEVPGEEGRLKPESELVMHSEQL